MEFQFPFESLAADVDNIYNKIVFFLPLQVQTTVEDFELHERQMTKKAPKSGTVECFLESTTAR